ncbi:Na(+)-translocating NADH-quinone reductase subunit A [Aureivirga sp. CE67]|uniref:Na(+)-translocating NADH-quinone reductase subunit A n=1 Tax=Aureivirga sp. CE67 TaxID=1788983 RepID=UPI0018CB19AB|nr:Na(+)-translocating NADH-quinone reductase subunit A [Aureivirga sp. CE67]
MSQDIRIRKGLDIKLKGKAEKVISDAPRSKDFAIKPTDIQGVVPKLTVKVGDKVKAGSPLFFSKSNDKIKFLSPVSGVISEVERGAKRKILAVKITSDAKNEYHDFGTKNPSNLSTAEVKEYLLEGGCWPFIKQRPYDIVANPADEPKAIFISGINTAPLAADNSFVLEEEKEAFQAGINALTKLTTGNVHLSVDGNSTSFLNNVQGVTLHNVTGKHPAGNVGVQIHKINPINQGERVWTIAPQDVVVIGRLFLTGKYDATRTMALAGSEVDVPRYHKITQGENVAELLKGKLSSDNVRVISGDVLTGTSIGKDGYFGFYDNLISVIPEGNYYNFMGWVPFTNNTKFSMSKLFFSWLSPNKEYVLDTNLNGEERALVVTGEMEKVMPIDIYPMQLLKAAMIGDIEKMENLGIYEVAPEDFALIDFTNTSKIEAQKIIREALDIMIKEVG